MARYLVEETHTKEECLRSLDALAGKGPEVLDRFQFACESGDHRSFATIDAGSESEVRRMIPSELSNVKIVPLKKYNVDQIRSFHK